MLPASYYRHSTTLLIHLATIAQGIAVKPRIFDRTNFIRQAHLDVNELPYRPFNTFKTRIILNKSMG